MSILFARRVDRGHWSRGTAGFGYPHHTAADVAHDDVATPIPRTADDRGREIAQRLRRAAGHVQLLELATGVERDEAAVG